MSGGGQNRFLLPQSGPTTSSTTTTTTVASSTSHNSASTTDDQTSIDDEQINQYAVDTDFDSYWEEEARNPHRNRIRIGRQYQATVPPLLKVSEKDTRKLEEMETLSFCPKRSAKVSSAELDHYFTVAKSLNLFASLVETRSLLGRDVTIADLNHIRNKEGLSLASVIQPVRHSAASTSNITSQFQQQSSSMTASGSNLPNSAGQQSPQNNCENTSSSSPKDQIVETQTLNQPLMKALSHFISLHHPCHHDQDCKKLSKEVPLEEDPLPSVSITAGNLRHGSISKESKLSRSRSSMKQQQQQQQSASTSKKVDDSEQDDRQSDNNIQSPSYDEWTREEVEMFSKAIEVCGKNFGSIKKDFLPSKSVKSIVEYYYIGSRDVPETKKKSAQLVDTSDGCSSPEKSMANNNGHGGNGGSGDGGPSTGSKSNSGSNVTNQPTSTANQTTSSRSTNSCGKSNNSSKALSDASESAQSTNQDEDINEKVSLALKQQKSGSQEINGFRNHKTKNFDARMSVYNFDEDFKEDSPVRLDCPRPGAEVKPLKAKPIMPNTQMVAEASNSNVGSLKFFMDGQLVLKLNACQEQQGEGAEKCHWVQSGDRVINTNRQKRYTKRSSDRAPEHNGSHTNSVISSNQDEDSKNDDLTSDEDSKESTTSFVNSAQQKRNHSGSPVTKKLKKKNEISDDINNSQKTQQQLSSPINYNLLAINNRMKEKNESLNQNQAIHQTTMPWFQANSLAVAAALLSGLPFPQQAVPNNNLSDFRTQNNGVIMDNNNMTAINVSASNPMDLTVGQNAPKSIQKSSSRSRNRSKN